MRYIFRLLLCVCFITFGLTACHKDEDIAALKAEIKQRWNIEVIDHDLQTTIGPLFLKLNNDGQLKDVTPQNEGACLKVVIRAFSVYPPDFHYEDMEYFKNLLRDHSPESRDAL